MWLHVTSHQNNLGSTQSTLHYSTLHYSTVKGGVQFSALLETLKIRQGQLALFKHHLHSQSSFCSLF